jgi:hypothetical protein
MAAVSCWLVTSVPGGLVDSPARTVTRGLAARAHRADPSKIIARTVWKAGMETAGDLMTGRPGQTG